MKKIISGGQTGVDQAALDVAMALGIEAGGWCPPGRICENGLIPARFPLQETPREYSIYAPHIPRSQRTEWNVRDAGATLVLLRAGKEIDKGTGWTIACAMRYKKPCLVTDPFEVDAANKIIEWLQPLKVSILNIAGPAETVCPGIGGQTKKLLRQVFFRE